MSSEELALGQAISIVLLVQKGEYWVRSVFAGILYVFLGGDIDTMKTALGTLFSSSALCYSDNPLINLVDYKNQIILSSWSFFATDSADFRKLFS